MRLLMVRPTYEEILQVNMLEIKYIDEQEIASFISALLFLSLTLQLDPTEP